jgi:transposase
LVEQQAANESIDLYYADETGVSEQGYCPYGWQFKDEKVSIPVSHGDQLNCFGLLSRDNKFRFKTTTTTINTFFLIAFFNDFVLGLSKPTVVVLDNAKIHHAKAFKERCHYWQSRGLFFIYLPPYSPHLNLIEKCWHELKQRWLRPEDYVSFEQLAYATTLALMAVGVDLLVKFKPYSIVVE